MSTSDSPFPHTLTLKIPFPTLQLSQHILRALSVDPELSPPDTLQRSFSTYPGTTEHGGEIGEKVSRRDTGGILEIRYQAATARMLRVAVNGIMESLKLCVRVAAELSPQVLEMERGEEAELIGT